jgi:16S rRNA (guanine527-N7)-methyltransferase
MDILIKNNDKIRNIILIKGKTYQQELDDAKKKYTFNVEKFRSITSDESYILKIRNIKPSTT